ncbi:MAG: ankyrin repeat domain-containing protein [Pseudomonadales bacterium]|nr:ankyrin repeat domain-containing protein [Pseudomonadales bacterium]
MSAGTVWFAVGLLICAVSCAMASTDKPALALRPGDVFADARLIQLSKAAERGDLRTIDRLVRRGVDVNTVGLRGFTPLFFAVKASNLDGVAALLAHGADPNLPNETGWTALHYASRFVGDFEIFRLLVESGAQLDRMTDGGETALHLAMLSLEDNPVKQKVEFLLAKGADIDARDGRGNTPMLHAAYDGNYEIVMFLINRGADFTLKTNAGRTIADAVAMAHLPGLEAEQIHWYWRVFEYLQSQGVDIERRRI